MRFTYNNKTRQFGYVGNYLADRAERKRDAKLRKADSIDDQSGSWFDRKYNGHKKLALYKSADKYENKANNLRSGGSYFKSHGE